MRRCLPLAVLVYSRELLRCPDIHLDLWTCLVYFCLIYPVGLLQVCRFSVPPLCSPRMSGNPWWPRCHAGTIRNEGELRLFTHSLATLRHVEKSFSCAPTVSTLILSCHVMAQAISGNMPRFCRQSRHRSPLLWDSPNLYAVSKVGFKSTPDLKTQVLLPKQHYLVALKWAP